MPKRKTGEPSWKIRRAMVLPMIVFCCWRMVMLENAPDTVVNQTFAAGYMWLAFGLIAVFTGFATIQDITAIWVARSGRPYKDEVGYDPDDGVQDQWRPRGAHRSPGWDNQDNDPPANFAG